jgi:23S rRNA (adenine2503-C2)-methyltransferase
MTLGTIQNDSESWGRLFLNWSRGDLIALCHRLEISEIHSQDLFRERYKNRSPMPWQRTGLPQRLKDFLAQTCDASSQPVNLDSGRESAYDRSVKFKTGLADGTFVETVLMPEKKRLTLCISTQVGCAQGCVFCHTGRMGLKRNLTTAEIIGQVVGVGDWIRNHPLWLKELGLPPEQGVSNIVFMGMGEPLDNVDNLAKAVEILTDPYGLALGMRHISISTAGHLDGLKVLLARLTGVRLALSVHSTDPRKRAKIMPIEKRWPLEEVVDFLVQVLPQRGGTVMLQYTLIDGVNDSHEEALALSSMAKRLEAKVNIIPLNPIAVNRLKSPTAQGLQKFRDVLHHEGVRVMVRYSKGQDIAAACGQLVI